MTPEHFNGVRDRFVWWACNFLLNHVASTSYRAWVWTLIRLGQERIERRLSLQELTRLSQDMPGGYR